MNIHQFEDPALAHFSYAVWSREGMVLVDPARNPEPYYQFAREKGLTILAVLETHPHADFVSGHLQIHLETGASLYAGSHFGVAYAHVPVEHGQLICAGNIRFRALATPGHSPDSISYVLIDENEAPAAIFSGDTLFIGDAGRPDLRENAGNEKENRESLARKLYRSLREQYLPLPDQTLLYPAHGKGSLCGKNLSDARYSTMGKEKKDNWSLQEQDETTFVKTLLESQPFIPAYFAWDVDLNRKGAPSLSHKLPETLNTIPGNDSWIIDTRSSEAFRRLHIPGAVNIPAGETDKFETWLGSILLPGEPFYLVSEQPRTDMERISKIGYENQVKGLLSANSGTEPSPEFPEKDFEIQPELFQIVDIRQTNENTEKIFDSAIAIPLAELRNRWTELDYSKPLVLHCAGGYRSAIGSSLLQKLAGPENLVYDLSTRVLLFV